VLTGQAAIAKPLLAAGLLTTQIKMTTIYTTQRCFTVEEDYDTIGKALIYPNTELLELTEVMTHHSEFPQFETTVTKRKVLIQKQYIVEVVGQACG
jgi:hypothetical protein